MSACGVCANKTASLAKSNRNSFWFSIVNSPSMFSLMLVRISFTKKRNSNVELWSPCFVYMFDSKNGEYVELYRTHALTVLYILLTALTNLELTFSLISFWKINVLSNLSKHFSKSTKAQYNFIFWLSVFVIIECRTKMQSIVDLPFWKPNWFFMIVSCFSDHFVKRFKSTVEYIFGRILSHLRLQFIVAFACFRTSET